MNITSKKVSSRIRRHARIRAKVFGTAERPRLSIYKSNRFLSGQIINDEKGVTLAAFSTKALKKGATKSSPRGADLAAQAGKELARLAKEKKITQVVFDRGGFVYTGIVKAFADAAREGGLEF